MKYSILFLFYFLRIERQKKSSNWSSNDSIRLTDSKHHIWIFPSENLNTPTVMFGFITKDVDTSFALHLCFLKSSAGCVNPKFPL